MQECHDGVPACSVCACGCVWRRSIGEVVVGGDSWVGVGITGGVRARAALFSPTLSTLPIPAIRFPHECDGFVTLIEVFFMFPEIINAS